MGHKGNSMDDLYDKIKEDVQFRREWAVRSGFGFELPSVVPSVPKCTENAEVAVAATPGLRHRLKGFVAVH